MKTRTQKYWADRFEAISIRNAKIGDQSEKTLVKLFKNTFNEMDKEIQAFYGKYGSIKKSPTFTTLSDGTKVLSGSSEKLIVPLSSANKPLTKGTRLSKLEAQLYSILKDMSKDQKDIMTSALIDTANGMYVDTMYEIHKGVGVGTSFNILTQPQVETLIRNEVNGQSFSTRVWNNRDKLANTVNQTLKSGITQGLSNGEMSKRIRDNMNTGSNVANRLIRTEVTNTYNQSSKLSYERSGIIYKYKYLATLDSRTSEICASLDGKIFKVSEAITGLNYPPMHVNCRSTTAPYIDDAAITRIARDVESGRTFTVPASMDVNNYKAIYVDKTLTREEWDKGKRIK